MNNGNINNANKMLMYRTILCLADSENGKCTVTSMARKLNAEKYQISRIISSLEQEEIVEKNEKGIPSLTKQGQAYISGYKERVELLVSFLLRAKLEPTYARDIALHIAGHANEKIMNVIEEYETKLQSKDSFQELIHFSGAQFAKKTKNASFTLPFVIIYKSNNSVFKFLNNKQTGSCILKVNNEKGILQFNPACEGLKEIKYFDNGEYISAEKVGDLFFLPADILDFIQMDASSQIGTSFLAISNIILAYEEKGQNEENEAIFQLLF